MPRPQDPEGRRNTVCVKLSDAELSVVHAARGHMQLSEWTRLALLAAAERQRPPAGSTADRAAEAVEQNLAAWHGNCPHPPARVIKGFCGACGKPVS